jgi:16S rRNA (cytosine967-C5)-methyltransferase
MATVSPARNAAFQILMSVERGKAHSDDLLRSKTVANLSLQDRNLATALVLGVLRWQIRLDQQIQSQLARPKAKLDAEVLVALRLGAFQLKHLDRIPARAAIDESVELTKLAGHRFASRMVNAVLRKLAYASAPELREGSTVELAFAQAHPEWMVRRWAGFYGLEAARAICRHGQEQSAVTIRIANAEAEREITATGIQLEPCGILTTARAADSGDVTSTEAFRKGFVRLQDEGSQLVAEIAGRGMAILDCCAAPGGKTLILAERNPDAHIVASEASEARLTKLRRRLAPLGERVECRLADATSLTEEGKYDLVLADVPCSGTGTLGRNPEIRHRLQEKDLPRQAERQREILRAALRAAQPGGRVVYSTCSLEPEENEQVVAAVLGETSCAQLASMQKRIDELLRDGVVTEKGMNFLHDCTTQAGFLRLLPDKAGTDGFFVALIEKMNPATL